MPQVSQARPITTTQNQVHDKLVELVEKYKQSEYKKPIQAHTQQVFDEAMEWLDGFAGPIVLDSCCGVGQSTAQLASVYPKARIIGIDKSAARLNKHHAYLNTQANYSVFRADVNDFWRLAKANNLVFEHHYLLYPNPYPKPADIQKRWYANAIMPTLIGLSNQLTVRSNWLLYLQEFEMAAGLYNFSAIVKELNTENPLTPFEKKYADSGQTCYELNLRLADE